MNKMLGEKRDRYRVEHLAPRLNCPPHRSSAFLCALLRVLDILFGEQKILLVPAEFAPPGSRRPVNRDGGRAFVEQDHRIGDILEHIGACLIARAICFARIQSKRALLTEWG